MNRTFFSGVALGAILLFQALDAKAAAIRLSPSATSVEVGSSFTIDVVAEDLNLGAYTLFVDYAAALVSMPVADPVVFDENLGLGLGLSFSDGQDLFGQVRLDELSFADEAILLGLQGAAPGNAFRLATLRFNANAAGVAAFNFGSALLTLNGDPLSADLIGATVEIGSVGPPVPEPSTWSAMAMGLAGVWMCRRRR